jgi:hypothetical protein
MASLPPTLLRACLAAASICFIAATDPPPNDNFADRMPLEGMAFEIRGSLETATFEDGAEKSYPSGGYTWGGDDPSVWYTWKPPVSGLVLVLPSTQTLDGLIRIATGATLDDVQLSQNIVALVPFPTPLHPSRYKIFRADAGVEYVIRVAGYRETNHFQFFVGLTNHPIIMEHPRTITVTPGANAFFSIGVALNENQLPSIQWQFNGTNLQGRTMPTLTFTNVTTDLAGDYRAIVTSPDSNGGFTSRTSRVAQLFVKQSDAPRLTIQRIGTDVFVDIAGEVGRSYMLRPVKGMENDYFYGGSALSDAFPFRLNERYRTNELARGIYAGVWEPLNNVCDLNLRRIWFAKHRLAHDYSMNAGEGYPINDLDMYIGEELQCPEGGIYYHNYIGTLPFCNITGHQIEYWRVSPLGTPW